MSVPYEREIILQHFKQKFNWDCGLACVLMVLDGKKKDHFINNFSEICKEEEFNKSTWTIDLCYILNRYHIPHVFFTQTLGVHKSYKNNIFYEKIFSRDEERVNERFKTADKIGIKLFEKNVNLDDVINHLQVGPIIVLTNAKLLNCEICKRNKITMELRKCLPIFIPYQGHYVVVIGYNIRSQVIYYRNPSFYNHVCMIKFANFEEARKCYGTDEDIIFINAKMNKE